MAGFEKGTPGAGGTFGPNQYLRSTEPSPRFESAMAMAGAVSTEVVTDSPRPQKILQKGEVLAKITSGPNAGGVGPFQAGATDGRQTLTNIVGLNDTFLPWQLLHHDEPVAVCYDGVAVQAWCTERDASGARIALTNTTAAAMFATKSLNLLFH